MEKITHFNKTYDDEEIDNKNHILIQYCKSEHNITLDKKKNTFSFIKFLLTLFTYLFTKYLEFSEDYSENSIQIDKVKPIEIKRADRSRPKKMGKLTIMICSFGLETAKTISKNYVKKYYETINEILFFYKDIGNRVYSICNDNYDIFMSEIYLESEKNLE